MAKMVNPLGPSFIDARDAEGKHVVFTAGQELTNEQAKLVRDDLLVDGGSAKSAAADASDEDKEDGDDHTPARPTSRSKRSSRSSK